MASEKSERVMYFDVDLDRVLQVYAEKMFRKELRVINTFVDTMKGRAVYVLFGKEEDDDGR